MPRGSDKHSPRLDEGLAHDTRSLVQGAPVEARAEDERTQEGPADDEPTPDALIQGDRGRTDPDLLDHEEVEARSRLAAHLSAAPWPADRHTLVTAAAAANAPEDVLKRLSSLPDGTFTHTEAVWEALGGRVEFRG